MCLIGTVLFSYNAWLSISTAEESKMLLIIGHRGMRGLIFPVDHRQFCFQTNADVSIHIYSLSFMNWAHKVAWSTRNSSLKVVVTEESLCKVTVTGANFRIESTSVFQGCDDITIKTRRCDTFGKGFCYCLHREEKLLISSKLIKIRFEKENPLEKVKW